MGFDVICHGFFATSVNVVPLPTNRERTEQWQQDVARYQVSPPPKARNAAATTTAPPPCSQKMSVLAGVPVLYEDSLPSPAVFHRRHSDGRCRFLRTLRRACSATATPAAHVTCCQCSYLRLTNVCSFFFVFTCEADTRVSILVLSALSERHLVTDIFFFSFWIDCDVEEWVIDES